VGASVNLHEKCIFTQKEKNVTDADNISKMFKGKPLLPKDKIDIIKHMNHVLKKHSIDINIDVDQCIDYLHDDYENIPPLLVFRDNCPFSKYFRERIITYLTDLNHSLYAFKCPNHAIEMLENNDLRLTSLKKNEKNDPLEYQEFWYRLGNISRMIPDNYDSREDIKLKLNGLIDDSNKESLNVQEILCRLDSIIKGFSKNAIKNWLCNNEDEIPMDEDRKRIYIYCLTRNPSSRHWKEYGNNDENICIKYNFKPKTDNNEAFKYGNVYYDNGYDFDFLREINYYVRTEYGLFFNPSGWTRFALFYKRDKYRWEEETRLSLNSANWPSIRDYAKRKEKGLEFKDGDANCGIICIKSNNDYVSWEVKSVTIGANCPKEDKQKIQDIIKGNANYILTEVIKR
jgi:hypothetical protein